MDERIQELQIPERNFLNSMNLYIKSCRMFDSIDSLDLAYRNVTDTRCVIARGQINIPDILRDDPRATQPIPILGGGKFRILMQYNQKKEVAVMRKFSICYECLELLHKICGIDSLRYDYDFGMAKSNIDENFYDNPEHPIGHTHLNYISHQDDRFRFPTASLDPRFILVAVSKQYERLRETL